VELELVSEIGIEVVNQSPTIASDPSFVVHWTRLSPTAVQQMLSNNQLAVLETQ
jgi:hypothetical protein